MEIRNIYGSILLTVDYADLRGANLRDANLRNANLRNANLCGADLRNADLCGANLRDANLRNANLRGADLRNADLCGADLRNADLCGANLCNADLRDANLCDADLCGANLRDANLCNADLRGAKNFLPQLYILKQLPPKTKITLWKYLQSGKSPYAENPILYIVGKIYKEAVFESDERENCGTGLSLATLQWCLKNSSNCDPSISFIECQFTPTDIVAVPFATDGKIRVKKLKVLREVNREEAEKILKESMNMEGEEKHA